MNEFMERSRRHAASHDVDGEIARDVAALAAGTSLALPTVGETMSRARNRARSRAGSPPMAAIRFFGMRPLLTTAVAVALGLFVVFGLPISYSQIVGHDVSLTLAGPGLDVDRVASIAREMKSLLDAESVRVEAEMAAAGVTYRLAASVPARAGTAADRTMTALATTLKAAGYTATAEVTPRTERVSGTMYAYAADRIIRVEMDGKSPAQIEAEIRDALLAAGFRDADVSVTEGGDGQTRVTVGIEADAQPGDPTVECPTIVLTKGGDEMGGPNGERCEVKIRKTRDATGAESMVLDVTKGDRSATVEVPNAGSMSDADLRWEIQTQLDRAGMDLRVDVTDGRIGVECR